jgi:hypothetical protein
VSYNHYSTLQGERDLSLWIKACTHAHAHTPSLFPPLSSPLSISLFLCHRCLFRVIFRHLLKQFRIVRVIFLSCYTTLKYYWLTMWSSVLLQKLTVPQLLKKFSAFSLSVSPLPLSCNFSSFTETISHCASYFLSCYTTLKYYWLTMWSSVLLQKLTVPQLLKKFSAFYGIWTFIDSFTSTRHCPFCGPDESSPRPHRSSWRSIIILCPHPRLGLPNSLIPSDFPTKLLLARLLSPYVPPTQPISFLFCKYFECCQLYKTREWVCFLRYQI